jgi:hypothetical protein
MDGSPSSIIMLGLGNGTFDGSPSLVVTGGFGIGVAVVVPTSPQVFNVIDRQGEFEVDDGNS